MNQLGSVLFGAAALRRPTTWLPAGDLAWPVVANATPDLVLGAAYLWWLRSTA